MIDTGRALLRHLLVAGYEDLKRRLTRRLGSVDLATEALHETYLRLDGSAELGSVRQPASYLYRTALNAAADRHRADMRWAGKAQLEAVLRLDEDELDPERIAAARSEIANLGRVLAELPARRRDIFIAALAEEQPYRTIAARFGISVRSVEREVGLALDHCGRRLEKKLQRRAGRGA